MLTKEQLFEISYGALRLVEQDGYWFFRRFTKEQEDLMVRRLDMRRFDSASCIRLEFITRGGEISFDYSAVQATGRNFCSFDIAVDGVLTYHFEEKNHTKKDRLSYVVPQADAPVRVTVYFSCYSSMGLKNVCLPEDYQPTARKMKLLVLGDSITHGSDASYPSLSYANQLTDHFDAWTLNQGIGGDYFLDENLDPQLPFAPDLITVAYGTNDWSRGSLLDNTMARDYLDKLTNIYPGTPVFMLLPIYRMDETEPKHGIYLQEVRDRLAKLGEEYPNVHVVDCKKFVPWLPVFFHDGYLHPNELGYLHYGKHLIRVIEEFLAEK
jgi:lysophospholipase L1-like esterase